MSLSIRDQRLRPRKDPRQPRAHETRARILDAAREVFATYGYTAGTTNRVAEQAALSVGSLYQYFPNKDAILVALIDEHIDDGATRLLAAVDEVLARHRPAPPPLQELVDTAVATMIAVHATDRQLHHVLFAEAPRPVELVDRLYRLEAELVSMVAGLLRDHPEVTAPDVELAARMTVDTIEGVVHRVVTDQSSASSIDDDAFRAELTRMVTGYLSAA